MKKRVLSSMMLVAFLISIMSFTVAHAADGTVSVKAVKPDVDKTVSVTAEVSVEFDGEPGDTALAALKVYKWNDETGSFAQENGTFTKSADYKYVYGGTLSADATYKIEWDGGNRIFHTLAEYMPEVQCLFSNISFDDCISGYNKTGTDAYNMSWYENGDVFASAATSYNTDNKAFELKNNNAYFKNVYDWHFKLYRTAVVSFKYYFPATTVNDDSVATRIKFAPNELVEACQTDLSSYYFLECYAGNGGTTSSVSIAGNWINNPSDLKAADWNKIDMRITLKPDWVNKNSTKLVIDNVYFNGKLQSCVSEKSFGVFAQSFNDVFGKIGFSRVDWPSTDSSKNSAYVDNVLFYAPVEDAIKVVDKATNKDFAATATPSESYDLTVSVGNLPVETTSKLIFAEYKNDQLKKVTVREVSRRAPSCDLTISGVTSDSKYSAFVFDDLDNITPLRTNKTIDFSTKK